MFSWVLGNKSTTKISLTDMVRFIESSLAFFFTMMNIVVAPIRPFMVTYTVLAKRTTELNNYSNLLHSVFV
ncbi:hypothetical protein BJX76DRAFT_334611 [Aspergillus varians]